LRVHNRDAYAGVHEPEEERISMAGYEELCQAYLEAEPRWIATDRMLRELPHKMRQAISDHLAAPTGTAGLPTMVSHCPTAYVDLFRPTIDQNGQQEWERSTADRCLWADKDGIYCFGIGVCIEKSRGSLDASMIYFTFSVEAFDDRSIKLQIKNLDGSIVIDNIHDPASYANAAAVATARIVTSLKNPTTALGSRAPIGFIHSLNDASAAKSSSN
jgi:hypothetical protein